MLDLTIRYLREINYKSLDGFTNDYMSHPDYPSLFAITDSLNNQNIENVAANALFAQFENLPNKFITELVIDNKADFYILEKNENKINITNPTNKLKVNLIQIEEYWTGLILIIEENTQIENPIATHFNLRKYTSQIVILFLLGIYLLLFGNDFLNNIYGLIVTIGTLLSLEIFETTLLPKNKKSDSLFCNINTNFSCEDVIKSNSKLFLGLGFSDISIIYFSIFYFLQIIFHVNTTFFIGLTSLLSIPVIGYSIYLQKFKLKKWCVMCLLLSVLLLLNAVLFIVYQPVFSFAIIDFYKIFLSIGLVLFSWKYYKKNTLKKQEHESELNELLRFKRNEDNFYRIAKPIENEDAFNLLPKITIGNESAINTLTLFISPSCPHCHTAIKDAFNLLEKYNNQLKIHICFNINIENTENPYLIVAKTITSMFLNKQNDIEAIKNWHIDKFILEDFTKKWQINSNSILETENILKAQNYWCMENDLNYAPIQILNNLLFPSTYTINELHYFFKE